MRKNVSPIGKSAKIVMFLANGAIGLSAIHPCALVRFCYDQGRNRTLTVPPRALQNPFQL
jgi:hypothetical protein